MQVGAKNADGYGFYDIVRGGMDKGVGLTDLCARLDLPLEETVAAGDSANDLSMLRTAGLGVCMDNGTEDAKAAADRVIGDVREDGLAALIEELWFDGPKAEPSGRDLGSAVGTDRKRRRPMSFAPVYNEHSRALILGTWPSPKSLTRRTASGPCWPP